MAQGGGLYNDWYVGITNDPRKRLFKEHAFGWIHRDAYTSDDARKVESYFVNQCGTDGATGGGDYTTKHVYAYKKTAFTHP